MRPCGRCRRWSIPARRRVVAGRRSTARTGSTWPDARADRGWQTGLFSLYGRLVVKKYKTFLATYKPVGGVIRVVLVREPDRWVAYFSTDPDLSVASILETVADRWRWSRSSTTSRRFMERDSNNFAMCGPTWGRGT